MTADQPVGGTRVLVDVAGIDRPYWDETLDVMLVPAGMEAAAAVRQLLDERIGE